MMDNIYKLGSKWSSRELQIVFKSFQKYGDKLDKWEEVIEGRTSEMITELILLRREYLLYQYATIDGFIATILDYYNITSKNIDYIMELEQLLGPKWSFEELDLYFHLYVKNEGHDDKCDHNLLPNRTITMNRAVYKMTEQYSFCKESTAHGLYNIMLDNYRMFDRLHSKSNAKTFSTNGHTLVLKGNELNQANIQGSSSLLHVNYYNDESDKNMEDPGLGSSLQNINNNHYANEDHKNHGSTSLLNTSTTHANEGTSGSYKVDRVRLDVNKTSSTSADNKKRILEHNNCMDNKTQTLKRPKNGHAVPENSFLRLSRENMSLNLVRSFSVDHGVTHLQDAMRHKRKSDFPKQKSYKARRWLTHPSCKGLTSKRFDLPWCYWFYPATDVEFYTQNQFNTFLQQLRLGKIFRVARPIWSEIRQVFGKSRRLSPRFFYQERKKLEKYRQTIEQTFDSSSSNAASTFNDRMGLLPDTQVLAYVEQLQTFILGFIVSSDPEEQTCIISINSLGENYIKTIFKCKTNAIMVLNKENNGSESHSIGLNSETSKISYVPPSPGTLAKKLQLVSLVRDIIKRRDLLQADISRVTTKLSVANDLDLTSKQKRDEENPVKREHNWLLVNLNVTNRFLQASLDRIENEGSADTLIQKVGPQWTETQWATEFLDVSRANASLLVASNLQILKQSLPSRNMPGSESQENKIRSRQSHSITQLSMEIKRLVADCIALRNLLRYLDVETSNTVPTHIVERLASRFSELLNPRFQTNLDLYTEILNALQSFMQRKWGMEEF